LTHKFLILLVIAFGTWTTMKNESYRKSLYSEVMYLG